MPRGIRPRERLLPTNEIKLGRFVRHLDTPNKDYFDYDCRELSQTRLSPSEEMSDAGINAIGRSAQDLITDELSKELAHEAKLTSAGSWFYRLDNVEAHLDEAISTIGTKPWIELWSRNNQKIYFVVGYQTLEDARLEVATKHNTFCKCPAQTMMAPLLLNFLYNRYMPSTGWIDPEAKTYQASDGEDWTVTTAPGERVSAVCYREVRCKRLSSDSIENTPHTSKRRWQRAEADLVDDFGIRDVDDMIEVELAESLFLDRTTWKCFGDFENGFLAYLPTSPQDD